MYGWFSLFREPFTRQTRAVLPPDWCLDLYSVTKSPKEELQMRSFKSQEVEEHRGLDPDQRGRTLHRWEVIPSQTVADAATRSLNLGFYFRKH